MNELIQHEFNSITVNQRQHDGYINATAACKANGKLFADYQRLDSTQAFLDELSATIGIPVSVMGNPITGNSVTGKSHNGDSENAPCLVYVRQGGTPALQGTWVHPQVAIHLAQWLSPKFAVAVSQWVFDWMTTGRTPSQAGVDDALLRMEDRIVSRVVGELSAKMLPPAAPAVVAPRLPVHLDTLPDGFPLRCCYYDKQPLVYADDLLHIIGNHLRLPPKAALRRAKLREGEEFVTVSVSALALAYQCSRRELLAALALTSKLRSLTWLTAQGMAQYREHPSGVFVWYASQRQTFADLKRVFLHR